MNRNQKVGLAVIVILVITSLIGCNPDEAYAFPRKLWGDKEKQVNPIDQFYIDKSERENRQKKETGSYTNTHESGKTYVGKGPKTRSQRSGKRIAKRHDDPHRSTEHTPAENDREAFKQESIRLDAEGGPKSDSNYNKYESPGKLYREQDGEARR